MADVQNAAWPATVGETYNWTIQINPSSPPDLTGYVGDMQIKVAPGSPIVLEASTTNTYMTLGGVAGTVAINFPSSLIATAGTFQYELKLTDPNGVVSKPLGGSFAISSTVTP